MALDTALVVIAGLAGLAFSLAGYMDFRSAMKGEGLVCRRDQGPGGCKSVYMIPQAWLLGRIHFSQLAPPYFAALALASALYAAGSSWALYPALALGLAGLLAVPYLVYLELRVARAICPLCTAMHVAIIAYVAGLALSLL